MMTLTIISSQSHFYYVQRAVSNTWTNSQNSRPVLRQSEIKGGAFTDLPFGPDAATVPLDNALDYGQADAGAFVFMSTVQALKNAIKLVGITLIKADTVVLNVVDGFVFLILTAYLD